MRTAFVLLAIFLSTQSAAAKNAPSSELASWKRIVSEMNILYGNQPTLTWATTKNQNQIEICPDNTCVKIRAPRSTQSKILADFFYLLEFYAAPYYEQEKEWKPKKEVATYAYELLNEYRTQSKCNSTLETEIAHCVLRHLTKTHGIIVSISRDDEGHEEDSPVEIDEFFQASPK